MTVTVKLQVEVLPEASVPVQVTGVVPFGKVEPEGGEQATVAPGQLSVTVAANVTKALHWPEAAFTVMFAGHATEAGDCH